MKNNQKILYLEWLRLIAAFAVLLLHVVCTPFSMYPACFSEKEAFLIRFLRNFCNWGVPVFVMITGSLLLSSEKDLTLKKLFLKYIKRFVIVIVVFGTLYSLMEIVFIEKTFNLVILGRAILNTAKGMSWDHMWYVYMTVGLYALLPLFRTFTFDLESMALQDRKRAEKKLQYSLFILFLINSVIPYILFFIDVKNDLPSVSIYIFFLLLGYAVEKWNFCAKTKTAILLVVIYAVYIALIQFYPPVLVQSEPSLKTVGNDSPFTVFAAFGIFSLLKNVCKTRKGSRFVEVFSPLTFGIYLVHPVAINLCYKFFKITPDNYSCIVSLGITLCVTILFSIFVSLILKKLPGFKKII